MNRDRNYYRKQRRRTIHRKKEILRRIGGEAYVYAWADGAAGRFAKGKIHCSCWMCRRKSYDDPQIRDKRIAVMQQKFHSLHQTGDDGILTIHNVF